MCSRASGSATRSRRPAPRPRTITPPGSRATALVYRLNGRKFYSTGVLFAHWVAVVANDDNNVSTIAFVPRETNGITIIDDWSGFGQRVTGSGTTLFENVEVHPFSILSFAALFERPTSMGPFAQIMHAAVEQGIAEAALADTVHFVRTSARPWKDAGVDRASDDPYTVAAAGELKIRVDASSALLDRAGQVRRPRRSANRRSRRSPRLPSRWPRPRSLRPRRRCSLSSKLIELAGSSATSPSIGLDRHWRNARTHTVHDPVRWKYRAVGDYWLNGVNPPRHGAI